MASINNPILAIERLLEGKTTLKTRRTTHKNIICIGTEVLDHIKMVMNEDKEKAIALAVGEAERKAEEKLKSETELIQQILATEKEKEIREIKKTHKVQIKETKRKCALEEQRRAAKARIRYQAEKQNAIDETKQQMLAEREAKIEKALEKVRIELREEARIDKEKTVAFELKQASELALQNQRSAISNTRQECNRQKQIEIQKLIDEYTDQINQLEQKLEYTQNMFDIERKRKEDIQQLFVDLKEDYKRFQNYTKGYHSDYLLP